MEFLICDKNKMELGGIPDNVAIDFDIGDTNDVEITCERGFLDFGMYLICPGTEYGAMIEELDSWTSDSKETWMGNSFRRFLKEIVIEPPAGEDYRVVSGDAHDIMRELLKDSYDQFLPFRKAQAALRWRTTSLTATQML